MKRRTLIFLVIICCLQLAVLLSFIQTGNTVLNEGKRYRFRIGWHLGYGPNDEPTQVMDLVLERLKCTPEQAAEANRHRMTTVYIRIDKVDAEGFVDSVSWHLEQPATGDWFKARLNNAYEGKDYSLIYLHYPFNTRELYAWLPVNSKFFWEFDSGPGESWLDVFILDGQACAGDLYFRGVRADAFMEKYQAWEQSGAGNQ